jgi:uncharacterized protein (DUF927 family)
MHMDLPLLLDEVGEADGRDFGRTIYQLAGGQGKTRMRADSTMAPPKIWRTLVLSSGEVSTSEVLESAGNAVQGGQTVRLIDLPASDPVTNDGIILDIPEGLSHGALIDALKKACGTHFGSAGPAFVRALLQGGLLDMCAQLEVALEETVQDLLPPGAQGEMKRAAKRFALVAIAGEFAIEAGILPWQPGAAMYAVTMMFQRYTIARGGTGAHVEQVIPKLKGFLLAHASSRFAPLAKAIEKCIVDCAGYYDAGRGLFYLTPEAFQDACGGHNVRAAAKLLLEKDLLDAPDKGHFQKRVDIPGLDVRTRLYAVRATILNEEAINLFSILTEVGPEERTLQS